MRVLIVEPHTDKRRLLGEAVEARGHAAVVAPTVTAALALLRGEAVDGVLVGRVQADLPAEMVMRLCRGADRPACLVQEVDDEALARFLETMKAT